MIISNKRISAVCIRSYDTDRMDFFFFQRKDSIIFQQYHTLSSRLFCKFQMFFAFHFQIRDFIIFCFIKHSKQKSCSKQTNTGFCDIFFVNNSFSVSIQNLFICTSTVQVASCFKSFFHGFFRSVCHLMIFVEITDCPAI